MKVAISTDGSNVSAHFGRCPYFTIVEIEDGKILNTEQIANPGHHPGFLPEFLHGKGVKYIVAGGMGQRAGMLFEQNGIKSILGVSGTIAEVTQKLVQGVLEGGESSCTPGAGKGYGLDKTVCDHSDGDE